MAHQPRHHLCWPILALGTLLIASCTAESEASFRPTEAIRPIGPDYPAAHYEVDIAGQNRGDLRIWSPGGYTAETNGKQAIIHVSVRLRNDSDDRLALDLSRTDLELVTEDQRFIVVNEPAAVEGSTSVPARGLGRIDLYYPVPPNLQVGDISAFELNWSVSNAAGMVTNSTPFVKEQPETRTTYIYWQPAIYARWGYPWYYYY